MRSQSCRCCKTPWSSARAEPNELQMGMGHNIFTVSKSILIPHALSGSTEDSLNGAKAMLLFFCCWVRATVSRPDD